MSVPSLGTLIRRYPWPMLIGSTVVAVGASLVRDLVHEPGTIRAGEGVAIAVTLAGAICAVWALVVIVVRRRSDAHSS